MLESSDKQHGLALIIIISVLAVMAIIAISFAFTMRLEVKMARNYQDAVIARYVAEAGIAHARALFRSDKENEDRMRYDYYPDELWRVVFGGDEVDNDEDGVPDSRWIELTDGDGEIIGRYAVLVKDELAKIDINSSGNLSGEEGWSSYEVSFKRFLERVDKGGANHQALADRLVSFRYGSDGKPGAGDNDDDRDNVVLSSDGIDNDADGFRDNEAGEGESEGINEPDEFRIEYPYGDDKPFATPEEIKRVDGIKNIFDQLRGLITVHSKDKDVDIRGDNRWNINAIQTPDELYAIFQEAGAEDSGQVVVNCLDYKDEDFARSILELDEERYYGVEAVRINEIMVKPELDIDASGADKIKEGAWVPKGIDGLYENTTHDNVSMGKGRWEFRGMADGMHYLTVYGRQGYYVGKVYVAGTSQLMRHGDIFKKPVEVKGGSFKMEIQHPGIKGITCYFSGITLSQQPDCEYIELINLSPSEVEVGGWTIDGPESEGWTATIPKLGPDGSPVVMGPGPWYLVLAVDKYKRNLNPSPEISAIANNGVSFEDTWGRYLRSVAGLRLDEASCQLGFSKGLFPGQGILPDSPGEGDVITLRDRDGHVVDQVEYLPDQVWGHRAIEKGDPLYKDWELSDRVLERSSDKIRGTPAIANDNTGMNHEKLKRGKVKNNPFATIGELCEVSSSGGPWERIGSDVIKKVVDRLTVSGIRLEAEAHDLDRGDWDESLRHPPKTHWFVSDRWGDEGRWGWDEKDGLTNGVYLLHLYGSEGASISVAVHQSRDAGRGWFSFPAMRPGVDNGIRVGMVEVGGLDNPSSIYSVRTPDRTLEIKVRNEVISPPDEKARAYFDYILLSPLPNVRGRININTASKEVLCSLPGLNDQIAMRIIDGRPYGKKKTSFGIGELLRGDILIPDFLDRAEEEKEREKLARFKVISNLITVASDVYEIISIGQILEKGEVWAEKKLRVVIER